MVEQNSAYSTKSMLAGMLDIGGDDGKEEAMARGAIETKKACGREEWHIVETVLSLGVELVVLILDSYLSYVGLYLAY